MVKNPLKIWEENHFIEVVRELKSEQIEISYENIPEIRKAMSFDRRSKRNPEKCPYYRKNPPRPCHKGIEEFNCFLCACPNYDSKNPEGGCLINSKNGKIIKHKNLPSGKVWDCSNCKINHSPKEVEEFLQKNLGKLVDIYYSI